MRIEKEKCIGCEQCLPYCPVGAIAMVDWQDHSAAEIDQDACVECGTCHERSGICPAGAIYMPELQWPRSIREEFSNPNASHSSTLTQGRGTEEMKTNDVTDRYTEGFCGVGLELGRPGIGTSFRDIQTVAMALAGIGVAFEENNPVSALMTDIKAGIFRPEILEERVLSAILEFKIANDRLEEVLRTIRAVAPRIDTVFSLDLISRCAPDGSIPVIPIAETAGFRVRPNCKTNVGLGRPLSREDCP